MDIPEENQRPGGEFDELAFEIVEFKDLSTKAPLQATKAPLAVLSHDGFTSSVISLLCNKPLQSPGLDQEPFT